MKYVRFYGSNGFCGCDYEDYYAFEDDECNENTLDTMSDELAYDNAKSYTGELGIDFDSDVDEDSYYEDAYASSGWEYITKEEYDEQMGE